jgi:hypothetical protein|eukprot:COSAG06_NODE_2838_length_6195_cov_3.339019_9_plen_73_part_00
MMMMLSALALVLSTAQAAPAALTFAHSYGSHMVRLHTAQTTHLPDSWRAPACRWLTAAAAPLRRRAVPAAAG